MGSDESHFNVSVGSDEQSHKTVSTNHNRFEENGESKRYRTEVLLLTSGTLLLGHTSSQVLFFSYSLSECVRACVHACVRACLCARACVCVRARARAVCTIYCNSWGTCQVWLLDKHTMLLSSSYLQISSLSVRMRLRCILFSFYLLSLPVLEKSVGNSGLNCNVPCHSMSHRARKTRFTVGRQSGILLFRSFAVYFLLI